MLNDNRIPIVSSKFWAVFDVLILTGMAGLVAFSVWGYFESLAQYATADQSLTYERLQAFLADASTASFKQGSNVSRLLVAKPAQFLQPLLARFLGLGVANSLDLKANPYLIFSILQVSWGLVALLCLARVLVLIAACRVNRRHCYLLSLLMVTSFPMLKGLFKVLKCDCLSLAFASLALLVYPLARESGSFKRSRVFFALGLAIIACLEKDTMLPVVALICGVETLILFLEEKRSFAGKLGSLLLTGGAIGLLALALIYAAIPAVRHDPSRIGELFSYYPGYFLALPKWLLLLPFLGLCILHVWSGQKASKIPRTYLKTNATNILRGLQLIFLLAFLLSWFFQDNNMYAAGDLPGYPAAETFVGPSIFGTQMTTLDSSGFLTRLKLLANEIRIFYYQLPEPVVLILTFSPMLLLFLMRRGQRIPFFALGFLASFVSLNYLFNALMMVPIQGQYLCMPHFSACLLATLLALLTFQTLCQRHRNWSRVFLVVLGLGFVRPLSYARPAHFGYFSLFRSVPHENTDFLTQGISANWTWAGWGESSYSLSRYISEISARPTVVVYDYAAPFTLDPKITALEMLWSQSATKTNQALCIQRRDRAAEYLILSKNTVYRHAASNFYLNHFRKRAIRVAKSGDVEMAWLFHLGDFLEEMKVTCGQRN